MESVGKQVNKMPRGMCLTHCEVGSYNPASQKIHCASIESLTAQLHIKINDLC